MTAVEQLVETWRARQLKAYHAAKKVASKAVPLYAQPAMHESTTYSKCANELEAALKVKVAAR